MHKGTSYPGEHEAIVTKELWDAVHAILKESPRARAAKNRDGSDALLKGIIFSETGTAMTPTYTRKGDRLYHYYTSMNLIRNREVPAGSGPRRLSAAMVEGAVIAEMRRIICTPEVAARVIEEQQREGAPMDERVIVAATPSVQRPVGGTVSGRASPDRAAARRQGHGRSNRHGRRPSQQRHRYAGPGPGRQQASGGC